MSADAEELEYLQAQIRDYQQKSAMDSVTINLLETALWCCSQAKTLDEAKAIALPFLEARRVRLGDDQRPSLPSEVRHE